MTSKDPHFLFLPTTECQCVYVPQGLSTWDAEDQVVQIPTVQPGI
jgi:hypothetical protein